MKKYLAFPKNNGWETRLTLVGLMLSLSALECFGITFPPTATVPKNALRFSGGNRYGEVSRPSDFNLPRAITIEAWVNVSVFDKSSQAIITKGDDWGIVRFGNNGTRIAFRTRSGNTVHELASTASLTYNTWYHIAAVYDGATKSLYINGQLNASVPYTSSINPNAFPVQFGNNPEDWNRSFKGTLDTVRVWSIARTQPQIWADIDRDLRGDEGGLLGEWRFNEASGNVALDSSASQRNATLFNMVEGDRVAGLLFRPPPPISTIAKNALKFDGDDRQFIAVNDTYETQFDLSGTTLTLEAWVNITAFDKPSQAIVSKGESWGITRSDTTSKIAFHTKNGATINDLQSVSDLLLNRWYHIAAVFNGTQKLLYIDGVLEASVNYATALALNNFPVVIGGNAETPGRAFNGRLDMIRVWSTARTAAEVNDKLLRELRGNESGLLGEWRFNEPAGPNALDSSYGERHATLVNLTDPNRVDGIAFQIAVPPAATLAKSALRFTGASGANRPRVVIANEQKFDLSEGLTIETWVNVTAFDKPFQAIVTKGEAWGLTRSAETSKIALRTELELGAVDLESKTSLDLNRWYHLAAVFDGTEKRLYIDGVLDASASFTGPLLQNNFDVVLGGNAEQTDRAFQGYLDTVRIWSGARTVEQIRAQIDRDLLGNETGLLADWRFNEASGTTALDSSINGVNGTLTEMDDTNDRVTGLVFRDPADGDLALLFKPTGFQQQFVTLPNEARFDFQNQLTVECWVSFPSFPANTVALVSKGAGAWQVKLKPSGKIQFSTAGLTHTDATPISAVDLLSTATLPLNEWHHVAVTWNSVTQEKIIYIDGARDNSDANLQGALGENNFAVLFAAEPTSSASPPATSAQFIGTLDEVRIWETALSQDRIRENFMRNLNGTEPMLVGVWNFNEGSGAQVLDGKWQSGLHGTLSLDMNIFNRVEGQVLGPARSAQSSLFFDGVDDFVEIPHSAPLNLSASATIEAWIKPTGTGLRTILYKGADGYGFAVDANNYLRFFIDALPANALTSTRKVQNDVWQHVAVVINGTSHKTTFFINGEPAGSTDISVILNNTSSLFLGKRGGLSPSLYAGEMDEVRLWAVARSTLEIQFFAFQQLPYNTANLAAYLAFNEGSGITVKDGTLNRLTGTLNNMSNFNWDQGQIWGVPVLDDGLRLTADPNSRGLWVGQITLTKVNEVQKAINGASETATPTADAASIRVLLHVNSLGQVSLLKDVVVMETLSNPQDPNSAKVLVLVSDPRRIPEFQGAATRSGKRVGLRYGSAAYDFPGHALPMLGGVGPGVGCVGSVSLPADFATNPFKHRYHPDHRVGIGITRRLTFQFNGSPGGSLPSAPGYGVDRLTGTYKETLLGLHKIPLKVEGAFALHRLSQVDKLNNSN